MRIAMIGTGYVGLVSGACLAHIGHEVCCIDVDAGKIAALQAGEVPLYEDQLGAVVSAARRAGRLQFSTDYEEALDRALVIFIAVGTPGTAGGGADLSHVLAAARAIGRTLRHDATVVVKSTVPLGANERVLAVLREQLAQRPQPQPRIAIASNPEFLREGNAVHDFLRPDRVVVGYDEPIAREHLAAVYAPLAAYGVDLARAMIYTDVRSAELIKYAANAMLATRISFINEIAAIAEACGADIEEVRRGLGADRRIGPHFLRAGAGYGGSCFPKDVRALAQTAREHGVLPRLLDAVHAVNEAQKDLLWQRIVQYYGESVAGKTISVWGLAFKPGTDDMREAPSLPLIHALLAAGAKVQAADPVAVERARLVFGDEPRLTLFDCGEAALAGADALAIVTEWPAFAQIEPARLALSLKDRVVFDGRNLIEPQAARCAGLLHFGVGRGASAPGTVLPAMSPLAAAA